LTQSSLDAEARPRACARLARVCELTRHAAPEQSQHLARFLLQLYSLKAAQATSEQAAVRRVPRVAAHASSSDRLTAHVRQALFRAFTQLSSLAVTPESFEAQLALAVRPLLCAAFMDTGRLRPEDVSAEEIAALLAIEAANGFCVMAAADAEGGRTVRGSGVYLRSSRINHGAQAVQCTPPVLLKRLLCSVLPKRRAVRLLRRAGRCEQVSAIQSTA
jgi:hypothetical protein